MKFKKNVPSVVGEERDPSDPSNDAKRFFKKGNTYVIQPNDAVHFSETGLADFVRNPRKR